MTKTFLKEAGIVILLVIAIGILLAIIFYDYIPNNKTVPIKAEEYIMPESITKELDDASVKEQNIVRTYFVDSTDLDLYEETNDYDKGKANPFADYSDGTSNNTNTTNQTNNNIGGSSSEDSSSDQTSQTRNEVYMNTPGKNY